MSLTIQLTLLAVLVVAACAEPQTSAKDPRPLNEPFPDEGPNASTRPPASGSCYASVDCKIYGSECLFEGKGKGPGTCVRMAPTIPKGPGYRAPYPN